MILIKQGFWILLLTGCFHLYLLFPDFKLLLLAMGYIVGFIILRKGFFKNGGSFIQKKKED